MAQRRAWASAPLRKMAATLPARASWSRNRVQRSSATAEYTASRFHSPAWGLHHRKDV